MNSTIDILNRLLGVHSSSLASYMAFVSPWVGDGEQESLATVMDVVEDQNRMIKAIGQMILDQGGVVQSGAFPLTFTSLHDTSLDYLLRLLVRAQRDDIMLIEKCVASLDEHTVERALAEEALGSAQGHLELFEDLLSSEPHATA
jgi:hypothetical protein